MNIQRPDDGIESQEPDTEGHLVRNIDGDNVVDDTEGPSSLR